MSFLDPVLMSRILFGLTLFVHIVFATIGVGIPIMLALAEWRGIRTGISIIRCLPEGGRGVMSLR